MDAAAPPAPATLPNVKGEVRLPAADEVFVDEVRELTWKPPEREATGAFNPDRDTEGLSTLAPLELGAGGEVGAPNTGVKVYWGGAVEGRPAPVEAEELSTLAPLEAGAGGEVGAPNTGVKVYWEEAVEGTPVPVEATLPNNDDASVGADVNDGAVEAGLDAGDTTDDSEDSSDNAARAAPAFMDGEGAEEDPNPVEGLDTTPPGADAALVELVEVNPREGAFEPRLCPPVRFAPAVVVLVVVVVMREVREGVVEEGMDVVRDGRVAVAAMVAVAAGVVVAAVDDVWKLVVVDAITGPARHTGMQVSLTAPTLWYQHLLHYLTHSI